MIVLVVFIYSQMIFAQRQKIAILNTETVFIVSIGGVEPKSRTYKVAEELLSEISKVSGIKLKLVYLPLKRSTFQLNRGGIHAEFARIANYQEHVPNTIRIIEPVATIPVYVYTLKADFEVSGWGSLKPYKVLRVHGSLYSKKNLQKHDTQTVLTPLQAFRLLEANRADVFPLDYLSAQGILNLPEFRNTLIRRLDEPVHILRTYTFFSADYPKEALRFQEALIKLKESGVYKKILNEIR